MDKIEKNLWQSCCLVSRIYSTDEDKDGDLSCIFLLVELPLDRSSMQHTCKVCLQMRPPLMTNYDNDEGKNLSTSKRWFLLLPIPRRPWDKTKHIVDSLENWTMWTMLGWKISMGAQSKVSSILPSVIDRCCFFPCLQLFLLHFTDVSYIFIIYKSYIRSLTQTLSTTSHSIKFFSDFLTSNLVRLSL